MACACLPDAADTSALPSPLGAPPLWSTCITNHPFSTLKNGWHNPKAVLLFFSLTVLRKRGGGLHWLLLHLGARFVEK